MTWQPIETAPEDEFVLVGWRNQDDGSNIFGIDIKEDGLWVVHSNECEKLALFDGSDDFPETPPYTHWKIIERLPCDSLN